MKRKRKLRIEALRLAIKLAKEIAKDELMIPADGVVKAAEKFYVFLLIQSRRL